jgi:hypothetical protein
MKLSEAQDLAKQVRLDDPAIRILAFPFYGKNSYELSCEDTRTGYPFVLRGWDDWSRRRGIEI